jgi:hypothetical protein
VFKHVARCPVCREVFDELETPTEKLDGQVAAMLLAGPRAFHGKEKPACVENHNWTKGWIIEHHGEYPKETAMPKHPVGLVVYNTADLSHGNPAHLVAFIENSPQGNEIWWAWLSNTGRLGRIAAGQSWKPLEDDPALAALKKQQDAAKFAVDLDKVIRDLTTVNAALVRALEGLGKARQFGLNQLCWCDIADSQCCIAQPRCRDAQAALAAVEKLKKGELHG